MPDLLKTPVLRMAVAIAVVGAILAASADTSARRRRRRRRLSAAQKVKLKKAKALFAKAETKYNLGKFKEALKIYSRAYEVMPLPGFLFNIGQCHRMMKYYEKAIFFYRGYLRGGKNQANRKMVERLIAESQRRMDEQKKLLIERRKRIENRGLELAKQLEAIKRAQARAAAAVAASSRKGPLGPDKDRRKRARPVYKKWWFWTVIGISAALVAGGVTGGVLYFGRDTGTSMPTGSLGTLDRR